MKSSFILPRQTERETEIIDECINFKHKQPFSQEVQPGKHCSFLLLFFLFPLPLLGIWILLSSARFITAFLSDTTFPFLPSSAFSFLTSSVFFCKFFILCTALFCFSGPVTWIFSLRRLSCSNLSLSSFFAFSFAWYLW